MNKKKPRVPRFGIGQKVWTVIEATLTPRVDRLEIVGIKKTSLYGGDIFIYTLKDGLQEKDLRETALFFTKADLIKYLSY